MEKIDIVQIRIFGFHGRVGECVEEVFVKQPSVSPVTMLKEFTTYNILITFATS